MADGVVHVIEAPHREIDRLLDEAMAEVTDAAALLRQVSDLLPAALAGRGELRLPNDRRPRAEGGRGGQGRRRRAPPHRASPAGAAGRARLRRGTVRPWAPGFAEQTGWTGGAAGGDACENGLTRDELYERAKEQDVPGRSRMMNAELEQAVDEG